MITIKGLECQVKDTKILKGINLTAKKGEIHAIMGKNGCGKSTLLHTLMGNPIYRVKSGSIHLKSTDITKAETDDRSKLGLFMSFQTPYEFFETTTIEILTRMWAKATDNDADPNHFVSANKKVLENLMITREMLNRDFNVGFSGGERKRLEVLQMLILKPSVLLLDEVDTGLDIDSIILIGNALKDYQKKHKATVLIVTHLSTFLKYLIPNKVHVIKDGVVAKTGSKKLAEQIVEKGYSFIK